MVDGSTHYVDNVETTTAIG